MGILIVLNEKNVKICLSFLKTKNASIVTLICRECQALSPDMPIIILPPITKVQQKQFPQKSASIIENKKFAITVT